MISFVVMAAMSVAPEANAALFKRRRGRGAAGCVACGAPVAPAPCNSCGGFVPPGGQPLPTELPPSEMPRGTVPPAAGSATLEEGIEIPADLQAAINASEQRPQILEYLQNRAIPRQNRIEYLDTLRQTLVVNSKD